MQITKTWSAGTACASLIVASLLAALSAPGAIAQEARAAAAALTMEHARSRAARVSEVSYEFSVRLDGTSPEYAGSVAASFELSQADESLTLDFAGGSVASVVINGDAVESHYNGYFLTLPAEELVSGTNRVVVSFSRPYSVDGNGLYRFEDPEDGRVYLYTDFEPRTASFRLLISRI